MTSRESRKQRREAERRARKLAAKSTSNNSIPAPSSAAPTPEPPAAKPHSTAAAYIAELRAQSDRELEAEFGAEFMAYSREVSDRIARRHGLPVSNYPESNRAKRDPEEIAFAEPEIIRNEAARFSEPKVQRNNAAPKAPGHSTGPRTAAGKLASSRNSLKHGLASGSLTIPGEDSSAFEALRDALLAEHQPTDTTEHLLVLELAQSYWLQQRAIRFQNECFTTEGGVDEKRLALFLRYGTAYERAFHKALNTLFRRQKERRKAPPSPVSGFVSQNDPLPSPESSSLEFVSQKPGSPASAIAGFSPTGLQNSFETGRKLPHAA